jgi:hypothetical protein
MSKLDDDQLPSGYIDLKISKEYYELDEPVEFTVVNHFPTKIYVSNQCPKEPLHVFKWADDSWTQLHEEAVGGESKCINQPRSVEIAAEGSRTYNFNDWPNLFKDPGVYRIVMAVDHSPDLVYQDFQVLEPEQETIKPLPALLPPQTKLDDNSDFEVEIEYEDYEDQEDEREESDEYEAEESDEIE